MRTHIALAGLFVMSCARAGVSIEVERFNDSGERDSTITIQVEHGKLRVDQLDEEARRSAFIYDGRRVIDANLSEHSYALIERDQLEAAHRTANPQAWLREQLLAEVPVQRRADSMRILSAPPVLPGLEGTLSIEPTAHASRHAGIECRIYRVLIDGQARYEYCMAQGTAATKLKDFVDAGREATDLLSEFFATLGAPWMKDTLRLYWTHVYGIEGVPLELKELEGGAVISEFRVKAIGFTDIAADVFEIPEKLHRRGVLDFSAPASALPAPDDE